MGVLFDVRAGGQVFNAATGNWANRADGRVLGTLVNDGNFNSTNLLTNVGRGYDGDSVSPRLGVVWQPVRAQQVCHAGPTWQGSSPVSPR